MKSQEFKEKHKDCKVKPITNLLKRCVDEKRADDLLGTEIAAGITIAELLTEGLFAKSFIAFAVRLKIF